MNQQNNQIKRIDSGLILANVMALDKRSNVILALNSNKMLFILKWFEVILYVLLDKNNSIVKLYYAAVLDNLEKLKVNAINLYFLQNNIFHYGKIMGAIQMDICCQWQKRLHFVPPTWPMINNIALLANSLLRNSFAFIFKVVVLTDIA